MIDLIPKELIDYVPRIGNTTGCEPRDDKLGECCPIWGDAMPTIPRSQWRQIIEDDKPSMRPSLVWIHDQRQEGSCTANQMSAGLENVFSFSMGKENTVKLSPISLYKRTGNSPNSGSTVSGNVREARNRGVLPVDGEEAKLEAMGIPIATMPHVGFYEPYPSNWEDTAKYFRLGESYDIEDIEQFFSALLSGFCVGYGRAGHSILGIEPTWRSSQFFCMYQNSWGAGWGAGGIGADSEGFIARAINSYGAFAYRTHVHCPEHEKLSPIP